MSSAIPALPRHEAWGKFGQPDEVAAALVDKATATMSTSARTIWSAGFIPGGGDAPDEEIVDTVAQLAEKLLPKGTKVIVRLVRHRRPTRTRFRRQRVFIVLSTLYLTIMTK